MQLMSLASPHLFTPPSHALSPHDASSLNHSAAGHQLLGLPAPAAGQGRVLFQRGPDWRARDHLDLLQQRRDSPDRRAPRDWLPTLALRARDQARVAQARYDPPPLLKKPGVISAACFTWAGVAAGKSGVTGFTGDEYVSGTLAVLSLLFSLYDGGLTKSAAHAAEDKAREYQRLLLGQHLMLQQLKNRLRQSGEPELQAAVDVALFNIGVLHGLLDAHEEASAKTRNDDRVRDLRQLRQLHLDHFVALDQWMHLRKQQLAAPHDRQLQTRCQRAQAQSDALAAKIGALQTELERPVGDWLGSLWDQGFDGLTDSWITEWRDFWTTLVKAPADLTAACCSIASEFEAATEGAQALAHALDLATASIGAGVLPLGALVAVLDFKGGARIHDNASQGKKDTSRLLAHTQRVHARYLDEPDPLVRTMGCAVARQRALNLKKKLNQLHRDGRIGLARRLKGLVATLGSLPLAVTGTALVLAGVTALGTLPGAIVAAVFALGFMSLLGTTVAINRWNKRLARQEELAALGFIGEYGAAGVPALFLGQLELPAERASALKDNRYLVGEWLTAQLTALRDDPDQNICGAEQLMLDLTPEEDLPSMLDALRYLRAAGRLMSPADHRGTVRAVVAGLMGTKLYAPDERAHHRPSLAALHDRVLMPPRRAHGQLSGASFHRLGNARKKVGRRRLEGSGPAPVQWLRGFGRSSLATPGRTLALYRRLDTRDHRVSLTNAQHADGLSRRLLRELLADLPRQADGETIAWPQGITGDTGECLQALLKQMAQDCDRAAAMLEGAPVRHKSNKALATRLKCEARLAWRLREHVARESRQSLPWWG